ncbi:MAG: Fe-S cluster biogenesis protein NfuA [Salibacteraceae bacterium]|jgi:Fe-S cluster biogenesis protein NfuA
MKEPITIYAEMTPNPKAMKFVGNLAIVSNGESYEFTSAEKTENAPLARVLFTFPFVKSVMLSQNFITLTIVDNLVWDDVVMEVRDYLTNYLQAGQPIMDEDAMVSEIAVEIVEKEFAPLPKPGEVRDIDKKISHILKEYVSPAVENDGGAIAFESFEDGELKVRLSGACNGCPSSTQTLQYGVQNIFEKLLPQVTKVTAV